MFFLIHGIEDGPAVESSFELKNRLDGVFHDRIIGSYTGPDRPLLLKLSRKAEMTAMAISKMRNRK